MSFKNALDRWLADAGPGGLTRLADALGESVQTLNNWRTRESGVPPNKCRALSAATGIGLKVLRPSDWADYWPELAEPVKA